MGIKLIFRVSPHNLLLDMLYTQLMARIHKDGLFQIRGLNLVCGLKYMQNKHDASCAEVK